MSHDIPEKHPARQDQLIEAFKRGDITAFEELYRRRFKDLCRYISTLVSPEDAADVVQDVYVTVWNVRARLDVETDDALFYYLLRSARNRALMLIRRDKMHDSHTEEIAVQLSSGGKFSVQPHASTDGDSEDLIESMRHALLELPARSKEILTLRWYHGLSFEEISRLMGISYGYSHVLHNRALTALRDRLKIK